MTMITPSYLGETIEYSSLHACRSTLEDPPSRPFPFSHHSIPVPYRPYIRPPSTIMGLCCLGAPAVPAAGLYPTTIARKTRWRVSPSPLSGSRPCDDDPWRKDKEGLNSDENLTEGRGPCKLNRNTDFFQIFFIKLELENEIFNPFIYGPPLLCPGRG